MEAVVDEERAQVEEKDAGKSEDDEPSSQKRSKHTKKHKHKHSKKHKHKHKKRKNKRKSSSRSGSRSSSRSRSRSRESDGLKDSDDSNFEASCLVNSEDFGSFKLTKSVSRSRSPSPSSNKVSGVKELEVNSKSNFIPAFYSDAVRETQSRTTCRSRSKSESPPFYTHSDLENKARNLARSKSKSPPFYTAADLEENDKEHSKSESPAFYSQNDVESMSNLNPKPSSKSEFKLNCHSSTEDTEKSSSVAKEIESKKNRPKVSDKRSRSKSSSRSLSPKSHRKKRSASRSKSRSKSPRSKRERKSRSRSPSREKKKSSKKSRSRSRSSRSRSRSPRKSSRTYRSRSRDQKRSRSPVQRSRRSHRDSSPRRKLRDSSYNRQSSRKQRSSYRRSRSRSPKRHYSKRSRSRTPQRKLRRNSSRSISPRRGRSRSPRNKSYRRRSPYKSRSRRSRSRSYSSRRRSRSRSESRDRSKRRSRSKSADASHDKNTTVGNKDTCTSSVTKAKDLVGKAPTVTDPSNKRSLAQLTEFCKKLTEARGIKKESDGNQMTANEVKEDVEDDNPVSISHPFLVAPKKDITIPQVIFPVKPMLPPINMVDSNKPLTEQFPVSCGTKHHEKEWEGLSTEVIPDIDGSAALQPQTVFQQPQIQEKLDISSLVVKRLDAQRRLQTNPNDIDAMLALQEIEMKLNNWCQSNVKPGQFTGQLVKQMMPKEKFNTGYQAWARKDMFHNLNPVSGGIGMILLQKMGWEPGKSLGKRGEGMVEPIALTVKVDRKGLSSTADKPVGKKAISKAPMDLQGKHPISLLQEYCARRKWQIPDFTLIFDEGPPHSKQFLFKVAVNGYEYQHPIISGNKKHAKAQSAVAALKGLGLVPEDAQF